MAISLNGTTGVISGITDLPDAIIDTDMLAAGAVTEAKLGAGAVTESKLGSDQQQGLAKAWVNFNGTGTVAIRDSFNVSSVTDSDVGVYQVNFTTALADANYAAMASASDNALICGISPGRDTKTTTALSVVTRQDGSGRYDPTQVSVAIFGG